MFITVKWDRCELMLARYLLDGKKNNQKWKSHSKCFDLMRGIIREQKIVDDERLQTWMKFQVYTI